MSRGTADATTVAEVLDALKDRVVGATNDLFSHGPSPLEHTLDYRGDPGLVGPDSVSWRVIGDVAAFVGGIRGLLIQSAHPEVAAGVQDHSRYREDPLGRLARTSAYVTETTFGARPEVDAAVATVRRAHQHVVGRSDRDRPYAADTPGLAAWVHNALTDSFLVAFQAYGPEALTAEEADRFVMEQAEIGRLLDADPVPTTAPELASWIAEHPAVAASDATAEAVAFLSRPPLSLPILAGYRPLFHAALATLPRSVAAATGVDPSRWSSPVGRATVRSLRWTLGSSPSWHVALVRVGAPVPPGLFRQPLDVDAASDRDS